MLNISKQEFTALVQSVIENMPEGQTYEVIMQRVLARVPDQFDKREGSMIWNASGPSSVEISIIYTALLFILQCSFADTAPREYLIRRAAERGVAPKLAEHAMLRAEFNTEVPIGSRFSCETLNYVVIERMESDDTAETKSYRVQCETAGRIGNTLLGTLIPIEYIDKLSYAQLAELIIPGADDEETEVFRSRYMESLKAQAFGGNQADYKEKVMELAGVGAVKVFPVWNYDINPQSFVPDGVVTAWYNSMAATLPAAVQTWLAALYTAAVHLKLTIGGAVRIVIMDSIYGIPSKELLEAVQEAIDPPGYHGEGIGIAPIGHVVKVEGVTGVNINIALTLTYQNGWDFAAVKSYVIDAVDAYFNELAMGWQDAQYVVIRVSQIETRILACPGVIDIKNTLLNGSPDNVALDAVSIPVRGIVNG